MSYSSLQWIAFLLLFALIGAIAVGLVGGAG